MKVLFIVAKLFITARSSFPKQQITMSCVAICYNYYLSHTVAVDEPWPRNVFAPPNSTFLINCTRSSSNSPLWSIDLASDENPAQLQFKLRAKILNEHGVYELPTIEIPGMPSTLRLLINDTAGNNGTEITCDDETKSTVTDLYVYGESNVKLVK